MYKIMIVEDDEVTRQELKRYLENALYQVVCIEDFNLASEQIIEQHPDLVLLDMNLPDSGGLDICAHVRRISDVPIIFVTGNRTSMDELNCMMQGGDDYVTKPYQPPILLARIAAVLRRSTSEQEQGQIVLQHKELSLNIAAASAEHNGKKTELSKNELKILHCLLLHKGSIVSRSELIDYLWDNEVFIDDNTLSVNMTRIRQKLSAIGIEDFIETKRGMGYMV